MDLDLSFVRSRFPAFAQPDLADWSFFENAGGSFPCAATVDALNHFYLHTKVQPYGPYPASAAGAEAMDRSRRRWAEALGAAVDEVVFGPSTTANTYVLANALAPSLGPGVRVVVTNQDHEANTGAVRRVAEAAGAEVVEWRVDPVTGLLDLDRLVPLLTPTTAVVTMPHCSNIVGVENDVATVAALVHEVGARLVVDGVSYAPHGLPDVAALGVDVYLFSLYKVYSVHQGVMVVRNGWIDELPNQGHGFNAAYPAKRLAPAGPDHAQEGAAGAVLDYVEELHRHHGGSPDDDLAAATRAVSARWQAHERELLAPLLATLSELDGIRLLGPATTDGPTHRCPTVAFVPLAREPEAVAAALVDHGIMAGAGDFYANRVLSGLDVDPDRGVVRVSFVHYTSVDDIDRLSVALRAELG
ncbi:MAG: aminotransferase class V-fold PLP-dependent enzyme [Actinomycetota bacterium]